MLDDAEKARRAAYREGYAAGKKAGYLEAKPKTLWCKGCDGAFQPTTGRDGLCRSCWEPVANKRWLDRPKECMACGGLFVPVPRQMVYCEPCNKNGKRAEHDREWARKRREFRAYDREQSRRLAEYAEAHSK